MGGVIRQIVEEKLFLISFFVLLLFLNFVAFVYFDGFGWFVCFCYEI